MLSGIPPFHQPDGNHAVLYEKILAGPTFVRWPTEFNVLATDLIMKLMESDPSKRYGNLRNGSRDVFHHDWFKEVNWDMLQIRQITAPYVPNISGEGDASAYVTFIQVELPLTVGFADLNYTPRITLCMGWMLPIHTDTNFLTLNIPRKANYRMTGRV